MTARTAMTPARKERVWTACLGRCEECQNPVPPDGPGVEFDHIIPLWTATDDARRAELERDDNLQTLCPACHREKSRLEAPAYAKARRLAGETCTAKPRRQLQGRGFGDFTRKINGSVGLTARAARSPTPSGRAVRRGGE